MLFVKPPNLILRYGALRRLVQLVCWLFFSFVCCCCHCLDCHPVSTSLSSTGHDFVWLSTYPQTVNLVQDGTNGSGTKIHNSIPCPQCGSRIGMWLKWVWTKSSLGCVYKGWRKWSPFGWDLEGLASGMNEPQLWEKSLSLNQANQCLGLGSSHI